MFIALLLEVALPFLLGGLDFLQLSRTFARVGGDRLLPLQRAMEFPHHLGAGGSDHRQVMEVAGGLVRVIAIQQQAQGVGVATQVLAVEQAFELDLLLVQRRGERFRLSFEGRQCLLELAALFAKVVQFPLQARNLTFRVAQPVGGVGLVLLAGRDLLAQCLDPATQFA